MKVYYFQVTTKSPKVQEKKTKKSLRNTPEPAWYCIQKKTKTEKIAEWHFGHESLREGSQ